MDTPQIDALIAQLKQVKRNLKDDGVNIALVVGRFEVAPLLSELEKVLYVANIGNVVDRYLHLNPLSIDTDKMEQGVEVLTSSQEQFKTPRYSKTPIVDWIAISIDGKLEVKVLNMDGRCGKHTFYGEVIKSDKCENPVGLTDCWKINCFTFKNPKIQ